MLVEMYEENGYWYLKDTNGLPWQTNLPTTSGISPREAKQDSNSKLKQVIKLKEAGFTADEILELIKEL